MQETAGEVKWHSILLNDTSYRHNRQVIQERGSRSERIQIVNTGGYQGLCGLRAA